MSNELMLQCETLSHCIHLPAGSNRSAKNAKPTPTLAASVLRYAASLISGRQYCQR